MVPKFCPQSPISALTEWERTLPIGSSGSVLFESGLFGDVYAKTLPFSSLLVKVLWVTRGRNPFTYKKWIRTSLVIQWLRLYTSAAGDVGLILGGDTKILHAKQPKKKTIGGQISEEPGLIVLLLGYRVSCLNFSVYYLVCAWFYPRGPGSSPH